MLYKKIIEYVLLAILIIFVVSGITDRLYLGNKVTVQELLLNDWLPILSAFTLGFLYKESGQSR